MWTSSFAIAGRIFAAAAATAEPNAADTSY